MTSRNNAGVGSASSPFTVAADTTPPVTAAQCDGSACSNGWYTSSPVSVTLSAGDGAGSGAAQIKYTTDGVDPDATNGTLYAGAISLSAAQTTLKYRAFDAVGNVEPVATQTIRVDTSQPSAPAVLLAESSPFESIAGSTLYYNPSGSNTATFTASATTSDGESEIQKVSFPGLTGMTGGGDDVSSPYQGSYGWDDTATASPGAVSVVATNNAGLARSSTFTVTKDVTAPSGGAVTYPDGFQTGTSVAVATSNGTDSGTGVDATTGVLERKTAALSNGACGAFSATWSAVASPDTVAGGLCAIYRYRVSDKVGNEAIYTSGNVVEVDASGPGAPTLALGESSPLETVSGSTLYYNPSGSNAAAFSVAATTGDPESGIAQVDFPTVFGADSSSQTTGPFARTYSWTGGASASGSKTVTATDRAALSSSATFTVTPDTTAPAGGVFSYPDGYDTSGSVTIATPAASDSGAGVDAASAALERRTAMLSGGGCGTYGSWAAATSPDPVGNGLCAVYRYRISDDVGNEATYASASVVKSDTAGPTVTLADPGSPLRGTALTLNATALDGASGIQQVVLQYRTAGSSGAWTQIGSPDMSAPYAVDWDTTGVAEGLYDLRAIATDNAGNSSASLTVANRRVDNTAPDTTIDSSPASPSNNAAPTFTFSSSESGSTFECRIDGGGFSACSSPDTLSPALGAGGHTFDVRATDAAGNTDSTPASFAWTVDLTAPDTTIDSSPPSPSNNVTPTFAFSSTEPGSTFECRIDGGGWSPCASPDTLPALGGGGHTFDVRATDAAGNTDSTQASFAWTIDLAAPTVTITAPTSYVNGADANPYTISATSPDVDLQNVRFYEAPGGTTGCGTAGWSLIATASSSPYGASWTTPSSDGTEKICALATDAASNAGSDAKTITIDRTAPSGVTVSYPGGYAAGAVTIATGNGPDPDVAAGSAAIERQTATLTNGVCGSFGSFSVMTSPSSVPSGQCAMYRYRISDNAGNVATATSASVVKSDTVPPTSSIADPGANLRGTLTLTATATASDTGGSGVASVAFQRRPSSGGAWTTIGSPDTSAPYSVPFDTNSVGDGPYDFRAVATDNAANGEVSPVAITGRRVDNTPPTAAMLTPVDGARVRGANVGLTSSTSDSGSGVDPASVGYGIAPGSGSFTSQTSPWDTTGVADGTYRLHVTAADVAGNPVTSSDVTVSVDNTPPALLFTSPSGGARVSGTAALTATASDASPANPAVSFEYKLGSGSTWTSTPAAWDTTSLPAGDGLYDLRASATDAVGNQTEVVNASILVDNLPPSISITAPPANVNGSVPSPTQFGATATDAGSGVEDVQFLACSDTSNDCSTGTWNPLAGSPDSSAPYSVAWTIPSDGNHALKAIATDNASHTSSAIRNVNVDSTAPDTTITAHPADPSNAVPTFSYTATESSTFECRIDGGSWIPCASPTSFTGVPDGAHTVECRATDLAGNVDPSPASWTWLRDTTAPSVAIGDPGLTVRQTVALSSTQSDPGGANASGVASVQFEYSGDNGASWASTPPAWNTAAISDGLYVVHVVVRDAAGNETTVAVGHDIRVDNTAPTTSQDDPGALLRGTKTLTGSAADSGSGVARVDFQRSPAGAGTWTTITPSATTSPYSAAFDTTGAPDGRYDFRTVAYDVAGNSAASTPVTGRLVDNTAPAATMGDPGTNLRSTVPLTSNTADPGGVNASGVDASSITYEYAAQSDGLWHATGGGWNTTALPDGLYDLRVTVRDNAGNQTTSSAVTSRRIDNTKPATTDDAPSGWQSSDVSLRLTASDAGSGVNVTEYSVDGGPFQVGTTVDIPAPADGSDDGTHTIAYFSADNAGNVESTRSVSVLIDATPPACPSCSANDYLRGSTTLTASPAGGGSGIQSVTFEYVTHGGGAWATIGVPDTTAPYSVGWDTTTVADGHYDLEIVVRDNANNMSATYLSDKVVDNTPPNVSTVGAPGEGDFLAGSVPISASAADVTSPVASVDFLVDGSSIGTDTTAPFTTSWSSTSHADGPATIQVVVTDMAGNSKASAVRNVHVDNNAPSPTLADPGQYLSGTAPFSATSDPDTVQVDFQRSVSGSGTWATFASASSAPFGATLNTATLADGVYDFRVLAVDGTAHNGVSSIRSGVRIDNTAPTGALTAPVAGATVGGSSVSLGSTVSDGGSGVASLRYEVRPTGGGAFTAIAAVTSAPFGATWNTTALTSGGYDLRPVVTDRAGNTTTGAAVTVRVDTSAPSVGLGDPGATLSGAVTLNATVGGSAATQVTFSYSASGANKWMTIATDGDAPWNAAFDTTRVDDGLYDLRALVSDSTGNTSTSVRSGIRIDNTAPHLVSSTPEDGARVDSVDSIALVTSEAATPANVTLDGRPAVAPILDGARVTYGVGALAVGPHTLAGELKDASGKAGPFRVHFTVWPQSSSLAPEIEKNTTSGSATTLTSVDGFASVRMPAGAWSSQGNDWIVLHVAPGTPPAGLTNGFGRSSNTIDVSATWAIAGGFVHRFDRPLEITVQGGLEGVVPATLDGSTWRVLRRVPSAPDLPSAWDDGFYADGSGIHFLTRHLSMFALLRDLQAPAPPSNVRGTLKGGDLTLSWTPGADNSGAYDHVTVLADGSELGSFGADRTSGDIGPYATGDTRTFTLRETDLAGNQSDETNPLRIVPPLAGKTQAEAAAALAEAGFTVGRIIEAGSGAPGTVAATADVTLAEEGAAIDLTVVPGGAGLTKLLFQVVSAPRFRPVVRRTIAARVALTRAARVGAVLTSPRGRRLSSWRFSLRAGHTIVKLRMPPQVRRGGRYAIRWTARAGADKLTKTLRIRITSKPARRRVVNVVLAGSRLHNHVGTKGAKVVTASDENGAFDLAGSSSRNVQVIVVDVDQFGVGFVRDLHTVFPALRIVALSSSSHALRAALEAGAAVALPRSAPASTLTAVIARLSKPRGR